MKRKVGLIKMDRQKNRRNTGRKKRGTMREKRKGRRKVVLK